MYPAHLLSSVDVQALVEMLLQVGHHGVVPRHTVDAGVLQTCRLHHAAAHLHNQRDKLWRGGGRKGGTEQKGGELMESRKREVSVVKEKEEETEVVCWRKNGGMKQKIERKKEQKGWHFERKENETEI